MFAEIGQPHWFVLMLAGIMAFGPRQLAEMWERQRERWRGARELRRRRSDLEESESGVWTVVAGLIAALVITLWVERL